MTANVIGSFFIGWAIGALVMYAVSRNEMR